MAKKAVTPSKTKLLWAIVDEVDEIVYGPFTGTEDFALDELKGAVGSGETHRLCLLLAYAKAEMPKDPVITKLTNN